MVGRRSVAGWIDVLLFMSTEETTPTPKTPPQLRTTGRRGFVVLYQVSLVLVGLDVAEGAGTAPQLRLLFFLPRFG